jgi:hypothetical protein
MKGIGLGQMPRQGYHSPACVELGRRHVFPPPAAGWRFPHRRNVLGF